MVTIFGISTIKTTLTVRTTILRLSQQSMIQKPSYLHLLRLLITHSQINCTELEVGNIIEVLNSNKASGDDGISHKMLKGVSKTVSRPLCILMNRSFDEGIFPDIWKLANVIPIFKKGVKSQPSNYRPVALLSCIG